MFFLNSHRKDKCLVVLHIPKTAGTTFRYILSRQYKKRSILNIYENQKKFKKQSYLKEQSEKKKSRYDVIVGHFGMQFKDYFPVNSHCFTFMRNPIDLVVSTYNHNMFLNQKWKDDHVGFGEFIALNNINVSNRQTRMLSGVVNRDNVPHDLMYEMALKNIEENFVMVGLSEMFDESIFLLSSLLKWEPPYYVRENVSKKSVCKSDLSEGDVERVRKLNEWDIKLYKHVKRVFVDRWSEKGEQFQREFEGFLKDNRDFTMRNTPKVVWK